MYAAAGGLSLARRQDRRNVRKQHHTQEGVHQNLQKRFNQLQHLHAPASTADQYFRQSEQHNVLALKAAGLDPSSRLPSYVDLNRRITSFGSTDILEGKAATAWLEKEKRGTSYSFDEHRPRHSSDPHRKWSRRHRIQDSSYGGSSSDEDELPGHGPGAAGQQSSAANMLLYVGLFTVAIGLVIGFVGTGEKGFKTLELRLIGPTLICSGLFCCLIRILLCLCPSRCFRSCLRGPKKLKLGRGPRGPGGLEMGPGHTLNRHAFPADKQTDYYKYLPFAVLDKHPEQFILLRDTSHEKRSLIKPQGKRASDQSLCVPHINILNASSSDSVHDKGGRFEDDPHSLNSSYENLIIKSCSSNLETAQNVSTLLLVQEDKRELARLKSTLTFPDEDDQELSNAELSSDNLYYGHNLSSSCEDCNHLLPDADPDPDEPLRSPPPAKPQEPSSSRPPEMDPLSEPSSSESSSLASSVKINSSQKTVCFNFSDKTTNELVLSPDSLQSKPST
nr:PREDICTED: uncharacterized protein LOC109032483 isoform X1 [Bemisia tabaci]XP_018900185.1 PREDICTED: uncharacterized protein LOC109032483 isoform X1 [Bemisia tabaci]XP_018900186.1 PREDICTED: uncharacterized protein LOC109032483 isoform X1 [Bemisia tabaci]